MPNIHVKIALLKDEYLEDSELQEKTENLLQDIKQEVEVESAGLVPVKDLPKDAKPNKLIHLKFLNQRSRTRHKQFLIHHLETKI